jgi:phosphotransferase system enzyme I (PtsI)
MIIKAAEENNIKIGICGEMGGEIEYTILLLGLGLRRIQCCPCHDNTGSKKIIRSVTYERAKEVAETACSYNDPAETTEYLRNIAREIIPELIY